MPTAQASKHQVAIELLDRSIKLYVRGDSFFCALHLGAAAEELLSAYAREVELAPDQKMATAIDQIKEAIVALSNPSSPTETERAEKWAHDSLSKAKNSVKHKRGRGDRAVYFDAQEEGYDVIDRAVMTYIQLQAVLGLPDLPRIQEFDSHPGRGK